MWISNFLRLQLIRMELLSFLVHSGSWKHFCFLFMQNPLCIYYICFVFMQSRSFGHCFIHAKVTMSQWPWPIWRDQWPSKAKAPLLWMKRGCHGQKPLLHLPIAQFNQTARKQQKQGLLLPISGLKRQAGRKGGDSWILKHATVCPFWALPWLVLFGFFRSAENKMDSSNLAVIFSPNLLQSNDADKMSACTERKLRLQAAVIQTFIDHAEDIGMVTTFRDVSWSICVYSGLGSERYWWNSQNAILTCYLVVAVPCVVPPRPSQNSMGSTWGLVTAGGRS